MKKTVFLFTLLLTVCFTTFAQGKKGKSKKNNGTIGNMTVAAFNTMNAKGAAMVMAIQATSGQLSSADQALLMQVAMGGQKQLAVSQAVLDKATNAKTKLLATSEVEEQTTLASKLSEIAAAKGVTLPTGPDATAEAMVNQIQGLSGKSLDAFYINNSGIKGHQELQATMTKVKASASDAALTALATATLPVIRMHLKVSREEKSKMTGGGKKAKS